MKTSTRITLLSLLALTAGACAVPVDPPGRIVLPPADPEPREPLLDEEGCSLEAHALRFAGEALVDCGTVAFLRDSFVARECAAEAFASGTPFRVVYEGWGPDGPIADQLVGDHEGRVFETHQTWSPDDAYLTRRCDAPSIEPDGALTCEAWVPVLFRRCG